MLNKKEILEIIEQGESASVEFKDFKVRPESIAKGIVGMANSQGGVILLGISDDGKMTGIDNSINFEELVANITRNNIVPPIICNYYEIKLFETSIGVIEVPKGIDKPYQTNDGKFLIRVNSTNRVASQGELLRLFQQSGMFHFDSVGIDSTSVKDLNLFKIDGYFEKYGIKISEESDDEKIHILKNSDILTADGLVNIAGALIFGINPLKLLPHSGISFARFDGADIGSELFDKKEINGNIDSVIDETLSVILNNIQNPSTLVGAKRINIKSVYSPKVFRELITNALVHRNYSITGSKVRVLMFEDRIEFISPGRLPNTVTVEKLKIGVSYSVNPVIVKFMENMGYVDKIGRGLPMVYREALELNKKVEFKEIGEEFKVILEL